MPSHEAVGVFLQGHDGGDRRISIKSLKDNDISWMPRRLRLSLGDEEETEVLQVLTSIESELSLPQTRSTARRPGKKIGLDCDSAKSCRALLTEAATIVRRTLVVALRETAATTDALIVIGLADRRVAASRQFHGSVLVCNRYRAPTLAGLDALIGMQG